MKSTQPTTWQRARCLLATASLLFFTILNAPAILAQQPHLTAGQSIVTGQYLQSPGKKYYAMMQTDGNLCVYGGTPQQTTGNLWCHHRVAPGGQYVTVMQTDGNLCTYSGTPAGYTKTNWCTNAVAAGGQYVLAMQDDGNLCVYTGTPTQYVRGLWCHNTNVGKFAPPPPPLTSPHLTAGQSMVTGQYLQSPGKKFYVIQQSDGNLCVYGGTPQQATSNLWCHHQVAPGGQYVTVMQADGNLCTYSGTPAGYSRTNWCTNAVAPGGQYVLAMQDDGNLCVYTGTPTHYERGLWCHNTNVRREICEQPRCGVADAGGVKNDFDYDCSSIANPDIRQKCDAYNAAIPSAKHACGEPKGKGWKVCVRSKLPTIPNSLPWTGETVEVCFKQNRVAASCKDAFPWWMLVATGGKGQLQTCQNAYLQTGANACLEGARLIELCGDWFFGLTGSSGNLYRSPWSREACLIEARKK